MLLWSVSIRQRARAGLSIDKGTAQAMEENRDLLLRLPSGRIRLEAEALFGYGAAAASLQLLWRHKLLDVLAPQLAERFMKGKVSRYGFDAQNNAGCCRQRPQCIASWLRCCRSHVSLLCTP